MSMSYSYTIRTDHKWKNLRYRYEVPSRALTAKFDYQDASEESGVTDGFFCYLGIWYHLDEFTRLDCMTEDSPFSGWDGYAGDSFFSGVLIKLSEDGEQYQVGRYYR